MLFNPMKGSESGIDPNMLAAEADAVLEMEDDREVLEGIYVCLDVSNSMCGSSGFINETVTAAGCFHDE